MESSKPVYLQGRGRGRGRGALADSGGRRVNQENVWQRKVGRSSAVWAETPGQENGDWSRKLGQTKQSQSLVKSASFKEKSPTKNDRGQAYVPHFVGYSTYHPCSTQVPYLYKKLR